MQTRRTFIQAAGGGALASLLPLAASAQALEQVKIYYGFPAGSAGDSVARRIGEKVAGSAYSRNVAVVDNRPGAGGRIALEVLKSAAADGSVLALSPFSCTSIYPHVYSKLSYDANKDFAPVSIGAVMHHGLAVGPKVPTSVVTVRDFLAWAKANPQEANYGSPAAGSTPHFIGALLGLTANVDLRHVPYRGSVPGITDVVGGQIAAMVTPSGDFLANHRAGKLRMIATSGRQRSPFSPEVPTFAEQGFADLTTEEWFGFYAPAQTPAAAIARANAAVNAAVKERAVIDSLGVVGLIARGSTADEMAKSQQAEFERWGPLVRRIGFTAES
ncbi:twin-arginine translocation pathway signal protein [Variovorax paradoxus]|jgi:tripartite-type tricarboxylate transporter receptor subunit TctC|uniref:Bug family tripartite tricarboxylate transporter substrate binding protein n=1 Tax=Variovorax paradoxus TaxID=34073 RepID=UPI0006E6573C|nr:twin-arginine translocation pathway signal protein [Variovorax paradoxus]KPV10772.1 twin-arginine translocation pathway signal protein [Variovorax paradoxus]KPV10882.1 twin-arginine translocation pathway signal protein [Variovorax paradoxus]KPV11152.1 twin-arginine translocation pathway signal protein [Variovorax paradoxus]KPV24152.1 twin-arginine translocation pathway signal protein [Variovorax paradoxus]